MHNYSVQEIVQIHAAFRQLVLKQTHLLAKTPSNAAVLAEEVARRCSVLVRDLANFDENFGKLKESYLFFLEAVIKYAVFIDFGVKPLLAKCFVDNFIEQSPLTWKELQDNVPNIAQDSVKEIEKNGVWEAVEKIGRVGGAIGVRL